MRVDIPKDNPNMTCQAVPLQAQSMLSNHLDHDPPSRPDATPVLSHRPSVVDFLESYYPYLSAFISGWRLPMHHVIWQFSCSRARSLQGCKSEPLYSRRILSATGVGSAWGVDSPALDILKTGAHQL
ncbi:unnamed protein product [Pleuronectes platessa]|uniref:Uncharacterized protein n=1 Tax=Pleuronectes platessa TaxID=8262 RepID=A0A9N7UH66_PLEPL|nr:unnamed protein product [Pleuronectes platessa]